MWQALRTLLVQSASFGLLVVMLSLGSVELLPDGRVVVMLNESEDFSAAAWHLSVGKVKITILDVDSQAMLVPVHQLQVSIISKRSIVNNDIVRWVIDRFPAAVQWLPKRFDRVRYQQIRVAVTLEQKVLLEHARRNEQTVIISQ